MKSDGNNKKSTAHTKKRASRNPEGRKQAIIGAAADIISREGTKKVTNRSVAEAAGVPLGSTTQYFKSIDELRAAGLAEVAKRFQGEYDEFFTITEQGMNDVDVLVDCIYAYLSDSALIQTDVALRIAAMEDPEVRDIVKGAFTAFLAKCEKVMDRQRARILFAFIEGMMFNSIFAGIPYDRTTVRKAICLVMQGAEDEARCPAQT